MKLKLSTEEFVMIKTTYVPSLSGGGTGWGCNCELIKSKFLGIHLIMIKSKKIQSDRNDDQGQLS